MGRPEVKEAKQQYTVMLKPSVVKQIDMMAEKYGSTRSRLLSNMVENNLDEMKIMEKAGLFKMVVVSDKVMRKFKELLFSGKVSLDKNDKLDIRE
jgi:metal-responsive CopG/Arc/MetJ family transcriptional regulator